MNLRLALVAVLAVSGCKSKPTLDGPCDPEGMQMYRNASKNVADEDRATITVAALSEACAAKLPGGIVKGMEAVTHASTADRATIIAGVFAENLSFVKLACPEWEKLAPQIASIEPAKKSEFLYSGCKYERFGLLTKAEFEQSWKVSGYALLAVPMYAWFIDKNMEPAEAKRIARDMILEPEPPAENPPPAADAPPAAPAQ